MSYKHLTFAAASIALSVMTASAATITSSVLVDEAYSASTDPLTDPALRVAGAWDLTSGGGSFSVPDLVNWAVDLTADIDRQTFGDVAVYRLQVQGQHLAGGSSPVWTASIGLVLDEVVEPPQGTVQGSAFHGALGDNWYFHVEFARIGFIDYEIRAAHAQETTTVPDAGSTSVLLGSVFAVLALLRRKLD